MMMYKTIITVPILLGGLPRQWVIRGYAGYGLSKVWFKRGSTIYQVLKGDQVCAAGHSHLALDRIDCRWKITSTVLYQVCQVLDLVRQ